MRKRPFFRAFASVLIVILGGGPVYAIPQEVPPVKFNPPIPPTTVPTVDQPFFMSFCDPPTTTPNEICGHLTHETRNPTGGNPPYHFELDRMGGFLPFGLTLHPNGLVTGTPKARGSRDFRVCAVDLSGHFDCTNYTLNVREVPNATKGKKQAAPAPDPEDRDAVADTPKKGGMTSGMMLGLVGAAVGLGVGLAALSQLNIEANCGPAPVIPNSCLGIGRNSSSCNATLQEYGRWCSCMGRTFNTSTGSCS
jgi:hypothetical protein